MEFHRGHAIFRIRKTAWIAVLLLLLFSLHKTWQTASQVKPVAVQANSDSIAIQATDLEAIVFCRGIVDQKTFSIDSEFIDGRDRVYAVVNTRNFALPTKLVWYWGGVEVSRMECPPQEQCISSLGPDSLSVGNWSVDWIQGKRLLASKQFRMFPE